MPPRIRSFFPRPPYAREAKSPAPEAPQVFREFVETLQRLDAPRTGEGRLRRRAYGAPRKRRTLGNGHARPRTGRNRRRAP